MFLDAHARDRIGAAALIAWNFIALIGLAIEFSRALPNAGHASSLLRCLSLGATAAYLVLQTYFLAVRPSPIGRAEGIVPRASALLGAYLPAALTLLPTVSSNKLQLASALITTLGTAGAFYALFHLGAAFSLFPQARRLVLTGPYRFIRHPLYLFGELGLIGMSLAYAQPWALLIAALSFFAQFPRMRYEEKVLTAAFSGYSPYAARTSRLIPGIY